MLVDENVTRRENLKKIIQEKFMGDYAEVARLIGKSEGTLRKYLMPRSGRPISLDVAREIEEALDLASGYLEATSHADKKIYYIMIQVKENNTYSLVKWLYDNAPEVVDCSAVLGQFDVILKVSVDDYSHLEDFFNRLSRFPKIKRNETFSSIDSARWQRNQTAHYHVKDPHQAKTYLDHFRNMRIESLLKKIYDLEQGKVESYDSSFDRISLLDMIQSTRISYDSVREYQENIQEYQQYVAAEKERIQAGVKSRRIFIFPDQLIKFEQHKTELDLFMQCAAEVAAIGCEVRFMAEGKWRHRDHHVKPECFAIVDNAFVYVREKRLEKSVLHESEEELKIYRAIFKANWEEATTYETIQLHLKDFKF